MFPFIYEHLHLILVLSPLLGIGMLVLLPRRFEDAAPEVAVVSLGLTLFLSFVLLMLFASGSNLSFSGSLNWLEAEGITLGIAVDGFSAILLFFVALAVFLGMVIDWKRIKLRQKEAYLSLLAFEFGLMGFLASDDILSMYVFMEICILFAGMSVFFFSSELAGHLSKFVGFMSVSSLLFLTVVGFLIVAAGSSSLFAVQRITITPEIQAWIFFILFAGVVMRLGIFPMHDWARILSGENFGSVSIIAGLLPVTGVYFLYRVLPAFAFTLSQFSYVLMWVVASIIIVSALVALAQREMPLVVFYVLRVHFGFILLGLVSLSGQGIKGSAYELVSVIVTIVAASILFSLTHKSRAVGRGASPIFTLSFFVVMFALSGLPGLANFPGLFMIWMGLFKGSYPLAIFALLGMLFVVVSAVRSLSFEMRREIEAGFGSSGFSSKGIFLIVPLVVLIVGMGFFPSVVMNYLSDSSEAVWKILSQQM